MSRFLRFFYFLLFLLPLFDRVAAQCNDWSISTQLIAGSTCAGNGSFSVSLSGTDVANLTNIQYGIPVNSKGFSVPLNNSNIFNNVPPGIYKVSAVAFCNGSYVGKNTTVTIPGSYTTPSLTVKRSRGSLYCGAYGTMDVSVSNNRPPYTLAIVSAPANYSGSTVFTMPTSAYTLRNLPAGAYSMRVVDACGNSSFTQSDTIAFLNPGDIPLASGPVSNIGCDTVLIGMLSVQSNSNWINYLYDTLYKVSVSIGNSAFTPTSFQPINSNQFKIGMNPGFSLKDLYGQTLTYTVKPPCGNIFAFTQTINPPNAIIGIEQKCNNGFNALFNFYGLACFPVSYRFQDNNSSAQYGPFNLTNAGTNPVFLPLGSYTVHYTTADGYTGTASTGANPITGNPYSVSIMDGSYGLQNYIFSFKFSTSVSLGVKSIELFNGPAGYSYKYDQWGGNFFNIFENQTPTSPGTRLFPAGNYVWKITDSCGVYYLPITVTNQDLYQFTAGISKQKLTCQGLWVFPTGTAKRNGVTVPVKFYFLRNNKPVFFTPSTPVDIWNQYSAADSVLVTSPGTYTLLPTANSSVALVFPYPSPYTQTFSFNYTQKPVQIDVNHTQGFYCQGSGGASIYVQGKDGIPYSNAPYKYYLALQGNGATGPYISQNTTGVFTNFGGIVNADYDVKVEDSCGTFSIQKVKILDLRTSRLISLNDYVVCEGDSVQLNASYFPNAVYSWSGPNGFVSALRTPHILNFHTQHSGVYKVTIVIPGCVSAVSDSSIITMAPIPLKPILSVNCAAPVSLTILNATPPYDYAWEISELGFRYDIPDDGSRNIVVFSVGSYRAIAIDTTTGCTSYSDSVFFGADPHSIFTATIYSPHLQLCTGDTTILVANGNALSYQWFKNGVVIPGATNISYVTASPGNYKVYVDAGVCMKDTSVEVTVTVVVPPIASITTAVQAICQGDSTLIVASTGINYQYTWFLNGVSIAGAQGSTYKAYQPGNYSVTISNGGCVANSNVINITVLPTPVLSISPGDQDICPGVVVNFMTAFDGSYTYTWQLNGVNIPGAVSNQYQASVAGTYTVAASNGVCSATSLPVILRMLPASLDLGNDTVLCLQEPISFTLDAGSGFDNVVWSTGATTQQITITEGGTYRATVTNSCGSFIDSIHIFTLNDLEPFLSEDTVICNNSNSAVFTLPAPLTGILWSDGSTASFKNISAPGIYWVEAQSPCGMVYDTIDVKFCAPVIDGVSFSSDSICEGKCINIGSSTHNYPQYYQWTFSGGNPSSFIGSNPPTVCYPIAGVYPVTLTVSNTGGSDTYTKHIIVMPQPVGRFADTIISIPYKTLLSLPACAPALHVAWYENDSLICDHCNSLSFEAKNWRSTYLCVVRNGECSDTCIYKVEVTNIPSDAWVPTAFSPNGDGRNDRFTIITDNPNVYIVDLSVYNRWGQQMYRSNGREGWDGTFKGLPVEGGVYFWSLRYRVNGSNTLYQKQGDIMVVR